MASLGALLRDLGLAWRSLRRRPALVAAAAATLALAIGVTTAMFSVVNSVLLRPLPFPQPDQVVRLEERHASGERVNLTGATLHDVAQHVASFSYVAGYRLLPYNLSGDGAPEAITVARVSPGFFGVLGSHRLAGRLLAPEEFETGGERVVVLSESLWRRWLGADPAAVGRRVKLDGQPHVVVGVVADAQRFPDEVDAWQPMTPTRALVDNRRAHLFTTLARLRPPASPGDARRELAALAAEIRSLGSGQENIAGFDATPLQQRLTESLRPALVALVVAVLLVLLVACVNLASLLLAHGAGRTREMALRAALGAGRLQIVRQLLIESLVLAALGTVPGLLVAVGATHAARALAPSGLPRVEGIVVDVSALGFALLLGALSALLFGLWPALEAARGGLRATLAQGARGVAGPAHARAVLVVSEVALLVVLLGAAGLVGRTFLSLSATPLGLETDGVTSFYVSPAGERYRTAEPTVAFLDGALAELGSLPGARPAALASALPTRGLPSTSFGLEGRDPEAPDGTPLADVLAVSPGYFGMLGIPVLSGRGLADTDALGAPVVAVLSRAAARSFWPGESPLGRRLTLLHWDAPLEARVVGVVEDVRQAGPEGEVAPAVYFSHRQFSDRVLGFYFLVRAGEPGALATAIRTRLRSLDPDQPVSQLASLDDVLGAALAPRRFNALLLGSFAVLALVLVAVGIHGVVAWLVGERTREIGVRLALGARPGDVQRQFAVMGLRLTLLGVAIGLPAALAAGRALGSLLAGVSSVDPTSLAAASLLAIGCGLATAWLAARRAASLDPLVALRDE